MLRRKHLPLLYTRSHITRWQLVNFAVVKHFGKAQRRQRIGLVIGRQRQQAANAIEVDFIENMFADSAAVIRGQARHARDRYVFIVGIDHQHGKAQFAQSHAHRAP